MIYITGKGYIQLDEQQKEILNEFCKPDTKKKYLVLNGPAGVGKTLLAVEVAKILLYNFILKAKKKAEKCCLKFMLSP